MGYDIGRLETKKFAEQGVDFPILHPGTLLPITDGDGNPVTIRIGGADSTRIKTAVRERQALRRAENDKLPPGTPLPEYTWEMREKDTIEDLVTLTFGWSDNLELDGQPFPFSSENALILYTRFPEIAEQMTAKATSRINFMQASSTK
jgi:hypothetical protein